MKERVTLNELASRLAEMCGISLADAEKFVRNYFDIIGETLAKGENVKVKGLGTFKTVDIEARESVDVNTGRRVVIQGHRRATFTPEKSLAEKVNAPFAAFEAVELSDDIREDELIFGEEETAPEGLSVLEELSIQGSPTVVTPNKEYKEPAVEEEIITYVASSIAENETESGDNPTEEPIENNIEEEVIAEASNEELQAEDSIEQEPSDSVTYNDEAEEIYEEETQKNRGFMWGFLIGLASMLVILVGIWCWYRFAPKSFDSVLGRPSITTPSKQNVVNPTAQATPEVVTASPVNSDTTQVEVNAVATVDEEVEQATSVPTEPSKDVQPVEPKKAEPVYDKITKTRFLTTMAREHYGSYHLWPYIYLENQAILGHPDRIKPGTKVVIPPAEKYGINAKDRNCIEKAKKMGAEIYARYN